jgi:hypothetical protein
MEFLEGDIVVYKKMGAWLNLGINLTKKPNYIEICEIVKILNSIYFIVPIPHRVEEGFDLEKGYWVDSIFLHVELTRDNRIDKIFGI